MSGIEVNHDVARPRRAIGKCAVWLAKWAFKQAKTNTPHRQSLAPLTPNFDREQHQTYVDHLNSALGNDDLCNIALTGRYGAGKSSILKEFARQQAEQVLFLSLSTLGPDDVEQSRTNQIEKELVKQLLHREKPARLPQSRYERIDRLPMWRAVSTSALGLAAVGLTVWVLGALPDFPGLTNDLPWWIRVVAAVAALATAVYALALLRLAVHNRLISQVSAGGASISLTKSESYFDQYLDEIVYFFESLREVEIVIFEDLDRFDDPGIFEALRELNTLLNNSKQTDGRTIKFIYALRDSIFEKLGHDTVSQETDAAQAEAVRANRTKFFDLVIPVVPFITHRTSRDLLMKILYDDRLSTVVPVGGEVIDLTARHIPDMRLLTNIRNEYSVYAKSLITDRRGIEALEADKLFAMLVYKNIHLADFELVLLGRSDLDEIYRLSRELVAESIDNRRARLRKIADAVALRDALSERSALWGDQLEWFFSKVGAGRDPHSPLRGYRIGVREFEAKHVRDEEFWREVFDDANGVTAHHGNSNYNQFDTTATMDDVRRVLAGGLRQGLHSDDWDGAERVELDRERERLRADLEILRTADFEVLAKRSDFTLTRSGRATPFATLLAEHIDSEVGRALVADGFIDRYYALYVAQYYGDRVPPNAMNFIVHAVDTNRPDVNYSFNGDEEIAAVLRETKRSFLSEASAYNIGILDYLTTHDDPGAATVLDTIANNIDDVKQSFLQTYLAAGAQAVDATAYLAARWPAIFSQIIDVIKLAGDQRTELVDVALANSNREVDYTLDDVVRAYLQANYTLLPVLVDSLAHDETGANADSQENSMHRQRQVRNAVTTMSRAGFVCEDLRPLNMLATRLIVENDCYTMTAANLRTALHNPTSLSLDRIRSANADVYEDVLQQPDRYLEALANDSLFTTEAEAETRMNAARGHRAAAPGMADQARTEWTVEDPAAFSDVVTDLADHPKAQAVALISRAHPDCAIRELRTVPDTTWEALAQCQRFAPTLGNVTTHIEYVGELDKDLAALLSSEGAIFVPQSGQDSPEQPLEEAKIEVAETILKSVRTIPDPAMRVRLVASLDLKAWFPLDRVQPELGQLLGLLIAAQVCADSAATFELFDTSDWPTLHHAVRRSKKFKDFMTPELLSTEMVVRLLESPDISGEVKISLLKRFDEFVPAGHRAALTAAGRVALATSTPLGARQIRAIAAGTGEPSLPIELLHQIGDGLSVDEVLASLVTLPAPYSQLSTPGSKLTFPMDERIAQLLRRIHVDGRIASRTYQRSARKPARIEVTVKS